MDFAAIQASAPEGWVCGNNFSRRSEVMAKYSFRTAAFTAVLNRRRARPVNAPRAVLRGQKIASTTTFVSKTTIISDALLDDSERAGQSGLAVSWSVLLLPGANLLQQRQRAFPRGSWLPVRPGASAGLHALLRWGRHIPRTS